MVNKSEVTQKNIEYFDKISEQYLARPDFIEAARRSANAVLGTKAHGVEWNEDMKVLDFACGPGLISRNLCPHIKHIIGVDTSSKMCEAYNRQVYNQGISEDEMKAVCLDMLDPSFDLQHHPELANCDRVVVSLAYHHFENIDHATQILMKSLRPGGYLVVVDILKLNNEQSNPEAADPILAGAKETVVHHGGFTKETILNNFQRAGLQEIGFERAFDFTHQGIKKSTFVAWGRKI